jgi:hypothetical protein
MKKYLFDNYIQKVKYPLENIQVTDDNFNFIYIVFNKYTKLFKIGITNNLNQ